VMPTTADARAAAQARGRASFLTASVSHFQ
jgi:hypothetical protein